MSEYWKCRDKSRNRPEVPSQGKGKMKGEMKRLYLITGAAGHLAGAVIRKLRQKGCFMRGLVLPGEEGKDDRYISYFRGDVTRPETLDAFFSCPDGVQIVVLHLAALISLQEKVSPRLWDVNVNGTHNIIEKCRQYGVARLVYVSSVHAIAQTSAGAVISETDRFCPQEVEGAYAATKAQATRMVLDAGRNGLDVVVLHPSGITGPGDRGRNHLVQLALMYLQRKLPMGVRGGYDMVDVRDVADGIIAAVDRGRSGECYLLSNRYVSIPEILENLRLATCRRIRKYCCPLWFAALVAPLAEAWAKITGTRALFTRFSIRTLGTNRRFCHDKATRELGFRPRDIRETINDTVRYLLGCFCI